MDHPPVFPAELQGYRTVVQSYVNAKVKQFASGFTRRLNLGLPRDQMDMITNTVLNDMASLDSSSNRALRLVLRHDCQSTGCGELGCLLCQYNPSRLCRRNLKNKYLIDDHLKAKCGAPLRVELVDEGGGCVQEGLPPGVQLEIHVLNGEKYKEICPENTLLSHQQLKTCIISHHQKALLRRDGGSDDQLRCFLQLERGQAALSDLQVTTSSEALLAGKAPTFRLLVWAVNAAGEPVSNVTYVVSENFVVATKRVKHAIKSDIPSVSDHVSKLNHIGKATVDKLADLRVAAKEEGFDINVPDDLNSVTTVGQFQRLVELADMNTDLKNKVRHLLKLSPEKWEDVSSHAQQAVVPDFRPRVWWCPAIRAGLLFSCKNGAVMMDQPIALVKMGNQAKSEEDQVVMISNLDPMLYNTIPKLKANALQNWYATSHPGWAIYWKEGQQDPNILAAVQNEEHAAAVAASQVSVLTPPPLPPPAAAQQAASGHHQHSQLPLQPQLHHQPRSSNGASASHVVPPAPPVPMHRGASPFVTGVFPTSAAPIALDPAPPLHLPSSIPPPKSSRSPFEHLAPAMNLDMFPNFNGQAVPGPPVPPGPPPNTDAMAGMPLPQHLTNGTFSLGALEMLATDNLPNLGMGMGIERGASMLPSLGSLDLANFPSLPQDAAANAELGLQDGPPSKKQKTDDGEAPAAPGGAGAAAAAAAPAGQDEAQPAEA